MNPTRKAFLLDVLKVTPKKKPLVGQGDANAQATTAFKLYREEEKAVLAQIKKLGEHSDAETEKLVAALEAEVKAALAHLESAKKGDPGEVKSKSEEALKKLEATKKRADDAIPIAKARIEFSKAASQAKLVVAQLRVTSLSGKDIAKQEAASKAYAKEADIELKKKRATADEFKDGTKKLQQLADSLKAVGLKHVLETVEKDTSGAKKDESAFESKRDEFQKHLTTIEMADANSADAQRFRPVLQNAAKLAKDGKFPEATEALVVQLKDLENAAKLATRTKADDDQQTVKEPDYERRLPKILVRMADLKELPGSADKAGEFQRELNKAASMAKAGDFREAYKTLEPLKDGIDNAIQELTDSLADATEKIEKPTVKEVEDEIEKLRECAPEKVGPHETALRSALDKLMKGPNPKAIKAAQTSLGVVLKNVEKDVDAFGKTVNKWQSDAQDAQTKLERLKECVPFEKYRLCENDYKSIVELAEDLKYPEATSRLKVLSDDMDKFTSEVKAAEDKWKKEAKTVAAVGARLQNLDDMVRLGAGALGGEIRVASERYQSSLQQANNEKNYDNAVRLLKSAEADVKDIEKKAKPLMGLTEQKQDIQKKFFEKVVAPFSSGPMENLRKKVGKDAKITDLGAYTAEAENICDAFRRAVQAAADKATADKAFASSKQELDDLQEKIEEAIADKGKVADLQTAKKNREADKAKEQAYKAAAAEARQKIEDLVNVGGNAGLAAYEKRYTETGQGASKDFDAAAKTMKDLAKELQSSVEAQQQKLAALTAGTDKQLTALLEKLKALKEPDVVPKGFGAEFKTRVEKVKPLLASRNLECRELGVEQVRELETDLNNVITDTKQLPHKNNTDAIEALKGRLKDKLFSKNMPENARELQKELKEIEGRMAKQTPKGAAETLKKFTPKVDDAESVCGEIVTYRFKYDDRVPDAKAALEKLTEALKGAYKSKDKPSKYQGQLVKKLADADELRNKENRSDVEKAIKSIDEVIKEAGELLATSEKAVQEGNQSPLVKEENERLATESDLKLELRMWETEYKKNFLLGPLKAAEAAVEESERGDTQQLEFIKDLGKKVYDLGKKAKDIAALEQARAQLETATRHAKELAETPEGGTTISKKKIGQLKVEWRNRLKIFKASLTSLESEIIKRSTGDPTITDPQKTALKDHFERVANYFSPIDFDKPLKILDAEANEPLDKQRKAREQGLRTVRAHRQRLLKDPFVKHLATNPFGEVIDRKRMFQVLKNLDLNLQRCVEDA